MCSPAMLKQLSLTIMTQSIHCVKHNKTLQKYAGFRKENNRQGRLLRYHQTGTIAMCKGGDQNSRRTGEAEG